MAASRLRARAAGGRSWVERPPCARAKSDRHLLRAAAADVLRLRGRAARGRRNHKLNWVVSQFRTPVVWSDAMSSERKVWFRFHGRQVASRWPVFVTANVRTLILPTAEK